MRLYGLCDCPVQNAREIGDLLGFTRAYVHQLKGRALAKLKRRCSPTTIAHDDLPLVPCTATG